MRFCEKINLNKRYTSYVKRRMAKIMEIERDIRLPKSSHIKQTGLSLMVFEVPLNVIFNSLNGRIGSFRNAYEKQYGKRTLDTEIQIMSK